MKTFDGVSKILGGLGQLGTSNHVSGFFVDSITFK
jgi:hypothetical protein